METKNLPRLLYSSIVKNRNSVAFSFNSISYSYSQVAKRVAYIQSFLLNQKKSITTAGIIANQDFDTYCTIIACLLSGVTYIPIEPGHPDDRNNHIINQTNVKSIFCSDISDVSSTFKTLHKNRFVTIQLGEKEINDLHFSSSDNPAYILFTSGSTGVPKGVPINYQNLLAFVLNVDSMNLGITSQSKFLQVFDLTFDLSVFSYLVPLLYGSSVFHLPKSSLKYTQAIQLIENESITHILSVPSFVNYLKRYFNEINLPHVQNWLFCGEALKLDLVNLWQSCIPNANIYNVYGPTEATIFCTSYLCAKDSTKEMNGIVCIGKPFSGTKFELFDENHTLPSNENNGELFIAGLQLTSGYLNNESKNISAFSVYNGTNYYHSGDICIKDSDNDFFFTGRNDSQVKIQGYRVELGEIEYHASQFPHIDEAVVIAVRHEQQQILHLFYTSRQILSDSDISLFLGSKLPPYMIPTRFTRVPELPYNLNGKIDKLALQQLNA